MKVALLGAPGAGKTDIAKRLARGLNKDGKEKWAVIDGYVDRLAERTGRVYGPAAEYPHNVQVLCERWTLEAEASYQGKNTITCGTVYETLIYAAHINFQPPRNEEEMVTQYTYADLCMRFLGAMEDVTFNYDLLFYLPWQEEHPRTWETVVDAKIPEVLESQFRSWLELTGTPRKKATDALKSIRLLRDNFATPDYSEDDR